tara:strand:+ start:1354 stop:6642 length:5289 start_codon:yes stop_codon:yes gene_type:complete
VKHLFVILTSLSFVVGETNFPSTAAFSLEENGNKVRFQIPELEILETGDFQRISSKITGTTTDPGYPELPIYTAHISTDPAREYSFNYTVVNTHLLEDVSVFPFQSTEGDPLSNSIAQVNAQFYQSSEIYPLQNMIVSSPQSMRGLHLVQVSIIPFKFDPKTQTLEVWDEVEISMTDEGPNTNEELRQMPRSRIFEQLYDGLILDGGTGTPRDDDKYQQPAILYVCGGSSESSSYFQQLVDWRSKRGYVVYSAPTSETGNSASQIKNYIQNAYDTYDPPPEYVCLVGDVGGTYNIPTFAEEFGHNDFGSYCEGDHPFSQLDGTDLLPEVLIGRISIRSSAELGVVVNKIINYEKATYLSQISSYYEKAALAGDPYDSGVSCAISKEYVAEVMNSNGMDDIRLKTSGSSWSSWMRNQLDEGVLYFNYRGYVGVSGFDNGDIDAANNGYKLPFASVLTCGPGSFAEENTCLSEKFLRAGSISNPKGGIAAIATATWNTHTLFNNIVDMGIYDGIFSDGVETAGAALAKGKLALYMTYPTNPDLWVSAFTHWNNLMGDPATHLWSDTPQELFVEFPASINYGTNLVDITVIDENNNPVEDAMVTLFDVTQDSVKTRPTAGTGMVTFSLPPSYTNDLSVTVTKKNYKPFEGAITIVNNDINLSLSIVDEIIIDDSNGNSDGLLNPGEMINLQIPVSNLGVSDAENISAVISSTSDVITIEQGQSNYELIPAGESIYGGNFTITVSLSAVDRENLGLRLNMQDTSNEWVSYVPVRVNGSNLVINGTVVEGDGELNPGSIEDLSIVLFNDGMLTAENVSAELIYDGNLIDIISNNIQWISVDPQSTVQSESSFQIDISSDVINGTVIPIALHIFNDSGYDQVENLALQVGNVSVTDPLGPDQYGYYIYDSGDVGYEHTPVYNWIEIDPTYGGAGTALNIDDYGDGCAENQTWWCNNYIESEHVELPFSFQFYGVEYNEITISSNGWIAFGNSEMESFRNYPIPGAGGPTAMVAAFWDDLKTTSGGDVLFYADPGNDYFIIEWSDMRTYASNSWEDFQIILYNNPVPPFGDGEIKIQYKTFNNTSAGNYSAYPPIHGGYATIGTENQYANDGLQYTYDNEYPAAGMELDDGDAILITTNPAISMPMPSLSYTPTSVDFQLNPDETGSSEMVITNVGDEGSILEYAVSKEGLPPFDVIGGGPDEFDNIWSDSELEQDLNFEWIDISGIGTELSFSHNDEAADPIDLEFEFPFYGETYSQCIVNPNGWIGFGEDNTTWQNQNIPVPSAPRPAIFGLWDDLDPLQGGAVYYHSNSQRMVVWFDNVVHYPGNTNGVYNFQIVLFPNGDIQVNYLNISGADNSQTVGIQNGDGTIGLQVVYNDDYVDDNFSLHIKQLGPIDWLELESETGEFSGELNFEESVTFSITANSGNLPGGEYGALIKIETETSPIVELPVIMTIAGNFPPVASDDNYAIDEDYLLEISVEEGVLANDNDSDGDVFTAQLMDEPVHGSLTLNSDGSFSYEPELNFYGEDSFTYTAVDSNASNVAMVVIIVNPVNDLPGMFNLVSPSTDSVIVITPDNQEEILTFSWHEAENVDNDEITYNLDGTEGFSFLSEFIDLEENEYQFTYGELAEAMGDEDIVTADWNVSALDDEFTVLSENGPFTLTIDKSSLGISEPFIPEEFALYQNYPNPFNPVTTITYDIPEGTIVNLTIYDVMGRVVKTLVNEWNEPGRKAVMWNGIDEKGMSLTSGIYIYRINTSGFNEVKKLILLK